MAHVGVVDLGPDGAPRLVGRAAAVNGRLSRRDSGLPAQPEDPDGKGDASKVAPSAFKTLDLAPYRLGPDRPAFALRAVWIDAHASGVREHASAFVFALVKGRLRLVLATPMSSFLMTAGDWNKDGTREHDVEEGENVIATSATLTDGHFDWVVKNVSGPWRRIYRWSDAQGRYIAEARGADR